jgi:iron-sulfur cluster repair protein YtfE (RIC family)
MTVTPPETPDLEAMIEQTKIRDLVETYPQVMPLLNQHGIDICCGGGLTVPQAAEAHQLDVEQMNTQIIRSIRGEG